MACLYSGRGYSKYNEEKIRQCNLRIEDSAEKSPRPGHRPLDDPARHTTLRGKTQRQNAQTKTHTAPRTHAHARTKIRSNSSLIIRLVCSHLAATAAYARNSIAGRLHLR